MSNLVYAQNVQYVSNGKKYGRTNGILDAGILTPTVRYSGIVGKIKIGETCVLGDLVYPKDAATPYYMLADPTQAAIKGPANAILLEGGAVGEYVDALFEGYINIPAFLTAEYFTAKARVELDVGDVTVDAQTITMGAAVYGNDISDDGVVAGSTFVLVPASTSLAHFKAAFTKAAVNTVLAAMATDPGIRVETDWATDILAFVAVNAGVAGNLIATTETFTNGAFASTTMLLGTDAGVVYCGDSGKCACTANIPATSNDMVQVIGQAISPTELMFRPITDYDLSA